LRRTRTDHRIYRDSDFARLEQIVVLKFLGLPLRDIGSLLKSKTPNLRDTLRKQQHVLSEKRRRLDAAISAIGRAERSLDGSQEPDWKLFTLVVKEIEMQNETGWMKRYYSEGAHAKVESRRPLVAGAAGTRQPPLGGTHRRRRSRARTPRGSEERCRQALAARWDELLAGFTGGDPEIQQGLNTMWADRANWPEGKAKSFHLPAEVTAFVSKAKARS
jgi:DNA-binding transcriptional MerR regulator